MKAFVVKHGSPSNESLQLVDRNEPDPGAGQALVRIRAASLNYRDLFVASGGYRGGPLDRDVVPLSDGAGEVMAVGPGVTRIKPDQRVATTFFPGWIDGPPAPQKLRALGSPLDGTLSEYMLIDETGLIPLPDHLSTEEGGTLACAATTAWNALMCAGGHVQAGDTVLCMGTGGVSIFALQFAKAAGCRVIITSSSDEKLERAKAMGADDLINYKATPDWEKEVMRLTDGRGVDCVVELGGRGTLAKSYASIGYCGRVQFIGVLANNEPGETNPHPLAFRAASVNGIMVGSRLMLENAIRAMVISDIHPVIDKVFPFEDAPEAYRHLQAGKHFGKILIAV